jgi:hypothetical protein
VFVKTESLLLETVKSATYNNARFKVLTAASMKFVKNIIFVHREFRTSQHCLFVAEKCKFKHFINNYFSSHSITQQITFISNTLRFFSVVAWFMGDIFNLESYYFLFRLSFCRSGGKSEKRQETLFIYLHKTSNKISFMCYPADQEA